MQKTEIKGFTVASWSYHRKMYCVLLHYRKNLQTNCKMIFTCKQNWKSFHRTPKYCNCLCLISILLFWNFLCAGGSADVLNRIIDSSSRCSKTNTFFMYFCMTLTNCLLKIGMSLVWTQDNKNQTTMCPQPRFDLKHNYFQPSKSFQRLMRCFDLLWCKAIIF